MRVFKKNKKADFRKPVDRMYESELADGPSSLSARRNSDGSLKSITLLVYDGARDYGVELSVDEVRRITELANAINNSK